MRKLLLAAVLLFAAGLCFGEEFKIRIALNHAPPFRIVSGSDFSGIYIDIIKAAAMEMNAELEFIEVPFKRALVMMEEGNADMMLGPNRKPEREQYMVYLLDAPLPRANKAFYVHPESSPIEKYEDLYGKNIGVLRGAVYFNQFDEDNKLNKYEIPDYETGIRMVNGGRIDVLIMPEFSGDYTIKNMDINLQKSPYIVEGNVSFITVSKRSSLLSKCQLIEDALGIIESKGIVQEIIDKYK
ncbi:MAG: transporter substrate-binding domain-containing protein [Spirochaetales bacterium]|nr:transporter substrate-binding domain-containing protein [Spirochaetales bacterium]